jgi:16S rRNA C967 or C1407 C5-methylase (RsmB/RsmF family)
VRVTGNRPDQWARSGELFDLLLVDAPCSGQSLLCKGIKNPGCLGSGMVNGNAKRQKGIMLSAVQCVVPGGHIVYTTCTYDPEENEKVMAYILKRNPDWQAVEVPLLAPFRSALADFPAYRLLPAHGFGAGGFCCLLKKIK